MRFLLTSLTAIALTFGMANSAKAQGTCGPDLLIGPVLAILNVVPPELETIEWVTDDRLKWHKTHFHYEQKCKKNEFIKTVKDALMAMCGTMDGLAGMGLPGPIAQSMLGHIIDVNSSMNNLAAVGQNPITPAQYATETQTHMNDIDDSMTALQDDFMEVAPKDSSTTTYWKRGTCNVSFPF